MPDLAMWLSSANKIIVEILNHSVAPLSLLSFYNYVLDWAAPLPANQIEDDQRVAADLGW